MFSSIKPKLGDHLCVGLSVFTNSNLLRIQNCFVLIFRTILGLQQVKQAWLGKNIEINKQSVAIFWSNWRQYGSVLNSFNWISRTFWTSRKCLDLPIFYQTFLAVRASKFFTKTRANSSIYSRKPGNYNCTIVFGIDIMKKSSPIN